MKHVLRHILISTTTVDSPRSQVDRLITCQSKTLRLKSYTKGNRRYIAIRKDNGAPKSVLRNRVCRDAQIIVSVLCPVLVTYTYEYYICIPTHIISYARGNTYNVNVHTLIRKVYLYKQRRSRKWRRAESTVMDSVAF